MGAIGGFVAITRNGLLMPSTDQEGWEMQSPLTGLCEVLKLVKSSAENYRDQLQRNEAVTRAVLIDPVLRALGWEVANPAMVEVEKPITAGGKAGFLDYHLNAEKPIIIEAKKLDEPLENHFVQLVGYAFTLGVENMFISDGLKWEHYTNISATNQEPVRTIDLGQLGESELTRAAAYFVETLDAALFAPESQKVEDVLQQKYDSLEKKVLDLERTVLRIANEASLPATVESEPENHQMPWLFLNGSWDAKKKKPAKLRMPNGKVIDVRSWTQVLTEACKYCLSENQVLLQQLPIADRTGRATKLINTTRPPSNLNSDSFVVNDGTVYVCTNYSANDCVANAAFMFGKLGNVAANAAVLLAGDENYRIEK